MSTRGYSLFCFAPLLVVIPYLLLTITLFFWGPVNWPMANSSLLVIFFIIIILSIIFGYSLGNNGKIVVRNTDWTKHVFVCGCLASLALFYPAVKVYTRKEPWEFYNLLLHQGDAYRDMLLILKNESTTRQIVAGFRMLIAPFSIAVIPLAILFWSRLHAWQKGLFFLFVCSQLIFSCMRGTDKEVADLLIISFGASLVYFARSCYLLGRLPGLKKCLIVFCVVSVFLAGAFSIFIDRKLSRMGSDGVFCVSPSNICANYDGPILSTLSDHNKFGFAMLSVYLSHGYYGLYLALEQSFEPMFGIGHSAFLSGLYSKLTGDTEFYTRSYLSKIKETGWDDMSVWSTLFPWIANDVSFIGVPLVMCLAGFAFAKSWRAAVYQLDNVAAIIFSMLLLMFIYSPANNQLAQTADMFYAFWFWMIVWVLTNVSQMRKVHVRK